MSMENRKGETKDVVEKRKMERKRGRKRNQPFEPYESSAIEI
jgi:hypothetical protein